MYEDRMETVYVNNINQSNWALRKYRSIGTNAVGEISVMNNNCYLLTLLTVLFRFLRKIKHIFDKLWLFWKYIGWPKQLFLFNLKYVHLSVTSVFWIRGYKWGLDWSRCSLLRFPFSLTSHNSNFLCTFLTTNCECAVAGGEIS